MNNISIKKFLFILLFIAIFMLGGNIVHADDNNLIIDPTNTQTSNQTNSLLNPLYGNASLNNKNHTLAFRNLTASVNTLRTLMKVRTTSNQTVNTGSLTFDNLDWSKTITPSIYSDSSIDSTRQMGTSDFQYLTFNKADSKENSSISFALTQSGLQKIVANDDMKLPLHFTDGTNTYNAILILYEPLDTWMPSKRLQFTVSYALNQKSIKTNLFNSQSITITNTVPNNVWVDTDDSKDTNTYLRKSFMPYLKILMNNAYKVPSNGTYDYQTNLADRNANIGNMWGEFNASYNPLGLEYATNLQALIMPGPDLVPIVKTQDVDPATYNLSDLLNTIKSSTLNYLDISDYQPNYYQGLSTQLPFIDSLLSLNIRSAGLTDANITDSSKGNDTLSFIDSFNKHNLQSLDMSTINTSQSGIGGKMNFINSNKISSFITNDSWGSTSFTSNFQDLTNETPLFGSIRQETSNNKIKYVIRVPVKDVLSGMRDQDGLLKEIDYNNFSFSGDLGVYTWSSSQRTNIYNLYVNTPSSDYKPETKNDPNPQVYYDKDNKDIVIDWGQLFQNYGYSLRQIDFYLDAKNNNDNYTYSSVRKLNISYLRTTLNGIDTDGNIYDNSNDSTKVFGFWDYKTPYYTPLILQADGTYKYDIITPWPKQNSNLDKSGNVISYDINPYPLYSSDGYTGYNGTKAGYVSYSNTKFADFFYDQEATNEHNSVFKTLTGTLTADQAKNQQTINMYFRSYDESQGALQAPTLNFGRRKVTFGKDGEFLNDAKDDVNGGTITNGPMNYNNNLIISNFTTNGETVGDKYKVSVKIDPFSEVGNSTKTLNSNISIDYDGTNVLTNGSDQQEIFSFDGNRQTQVKHTFGAIKLKIPKEAWRDIQKSSQYETKAHYELTSGPS